MKLYTEEQVKSMLNRAKIFDGDVGKNFVYIFSEADILSAEKPIELPSDKEIKKFKKRLIGKFYKDGFDHGCKWIIDIIQAFNK